jgi:hypothetical protein
MNRTRPRQLGWLLAFGLLAVLVVVAAATAGSFLIVDEPRPSDAILVLAGETDNRPRRALELQKQGYGRNIVLDVPTNAKLYEFTQIELAERYVHDLHLEDARDNSSPGDPRPHIAPHAAMIVCPIDGLSTKDESRDAEKCLHRIGAHSVLIVTSDFHTRRALEIYRRELPDHQYSTAAARNDEQFGPRWWTHRQWAKVCFDEWTKLIWWKAVDQWR